MSCAKTKITHSLHCTTQPSGVSVHGSKGTDARCEREEGHEAGREKDEITARRCDGKGSGRGWGKDHDREEGINER